MLPKQRRLVEDKHFDRLFSKGRSVGGSLFVIRFVANGTGSTRLAFVVSTKVSKDAVKRNRLKRRMREATRALLGTIREGLDIAIIARPSAVDLDLARVRSAISEMLMRSRLLGSAS